MEISWIIALLLNAMLLKTFQEHSVAGNCTVRSILRSVDHRTSISRRTNVTELKINLSVRLLREATNWVCRMICDRLLTGGIYGCWDRACYSSTSYEPGLCRYGGIAVKIAHENLSVPSEIHWHAWFVATCHAYLSNIPTTCHCPRGDTRWLFLVGWRLYPGTGEGVGTLIRSRLVLGFTRKVVNFVVSFVVNGDVHVFLRFSSSGRGIPSDQFVTWKIPLKAVVINQEVTNYCYIM